MKLRNSHFFAAFFFYVLITFSNQVFACACGCGIFGVGTSSLIPNSEGGTAFLQYDYINQSRNWQGTERSPAENNDDKQIRSQTITAGMQYMFNRKWGAALRVPYVNRISKTSEDDSDNATTFNRVNSIGDIRINGIYSGFSDNMSSGVIFGLKLPTGQTNAKGFDSRDMQIGTGSTDALVGAYHLGRIGDGAKFNWFAQGNFQYPFLINNGYRPGHELSGATGISYNAGAFLRIKKIVPILQIIGSRKSHDTGFAADPQNSGYIHGYVAPAIELNFGQFRGYFDVEFPFYQNTNGNQLVATRIFKLILGYNF